MHRSIDLFDTEAIRTDLKGKTVRGGVFTAASQVASILISLASVSLLARLLDPEDFGLVAMVAVFTNFAAMFVDSGLSMATVQRAEITRQQASNLFWIGTALGLGIAFMVAVASPGVSWFYERPELQPITIALACAYIFSGMTVQFQALLRRAMLFDRLAIITVASQVAGVVAGVWWAWVAYDQPNDYWALVLLPLVTSVTRFVGVCVASGWRPGLPRRGAGTRELVGFGVNLTGFNLINYLRRNAGKALIGWYWGVEALGYFDRSMQLLLSPSGKVTAPLSAVIIPGLSRLKESPEAYRNMYRNAVSMLGNVSLPATGFLLASSEPLVLVAMGEEWGPVVPLFAALMPAAFLSSVACITGWCYASWGHVNRQFRWSLVNSAVVLATIAACLPWGAIAVAIGFSASAIVMRIPSMLVCFHGTPLSLRDALAPLAWPAVAATACALCLVGVDAMLMLENSWARLGVGAAVYTAALAGCFGLTSGGRTRAGVFLQMFRSLAARGDKQGQGQPLAAGRSVSSGAEP